ncbi:MAG TPA: hypothetical protein VNO51_00595 [Ilumatobacteraceae bacterium]|nr:hypothetical protein [Ilumatobacteraceae bacterium]
MGEPHDDENQGPDDAAVIADRERRIADARRSSIEAGRRKGGVAGAAMAGAMLAMRDIFDGPTKEEIPIEVEASGEPHDLDRDGVDLTVDGVDVSAPALERKDPLPAPKGRRSR